MTLNLGKLLFPHLPRDVRRYRVSMLMLILLTIAFGNATLVFCMMHGWR